MAGSSSFGKAYSNGMMRQLNMMGMMDSIIDVGAGSGTYKNLMKDDLPPTVKWTAVEVWEPNIEKYDLPNLYDSVVNEDVRTFDFSSAAGTDLVLFGDILEHMKKEEAVATIDKCLDHCKAYMIAIPIVHYPQGPVEGNPYEEHVKDDWSHDEVLETFGDIKCYFVHDHIGVYFGSRDGELSAMLPMFHQKISRLCEASFPNHKMLYSK